MTPPFFPFTSVPHCTLSFSLLQAFFTLDEFQLLLNHLMKLGRVFTNHSMYHIKKYKILLVFGEQYSGAGLIRLQQPRLGQGRLYFELRVPHLRRPPRRSWAKGVVDFDSRSKQKKKKIKKMKRELPTRNSLKILLCECLYFTPLHTMFKPSEKIAIVLWLFSLCFVFAFFNLRYTFCFGTYTIYNRYICNCSLRFAESLSLLRWQE